MANALYLSERFSELWKGKDPFDEVEKITGKVYRELDGRTTLRFELDGKGYFLKIHRGVGWIEIFKNLVQLRLPVLGAENEWKAIDKLKSIDVDTMTYVAYGKIGINPAKQLSFIITEDLAGCISLEDYCLSWTENLPPNELRLTIIRTVAKISRALHEHGVNHRDFYICHFLLDINEDVSEPRLYLIDLHRAQIRKQVPNRWIVKDIAGLWYSMIEVDMFGDGLELFKREYGKTNVFKSIWHKNFWTLIEGKANALLEKEKSD